MSESGGSQIGAEHAQKHGRRNRARGGDFSRASRAAGRPPEGDRGAIGIVSSRRVLSHITQSGARKTFVCKIRESAEMRRTVLQHVQTIIAIIVHCVQGDMRMRAECACVERSARAPSAIEACAAVAAGSTRRTIARIARTC